MTFAVLMVCLYFEFCHMNSAFVHHKIISYFFPKIKFKKYIFIFTLLRFVLSFYIKISKFSLRNFNPS